MKVTVQLGSKKKDRQVVLDDTKTNTIADLKLAYAKTYGLSVYRQCYKTTTPEASICADACHVTNGMVLRLKDFGPQIGYRTVFILEYLGPLVFVLLYAIRPAMIYGPAASSWNPMAITGVVCWSAHFLKREFETIFVHRFSKPTMPLFNLFKNCAYYWTFGLCIGYPLCHPDYTGPDPKSVQVSLGVAIFVLSEICNFAVHWQFRSMRKAEGDTARKIPMGILFETVSCPNYTFEVLGWIGFSLMTQVAFAYVFTLVGFLQMIDWALKKHRGYLKSHKEYKALGRKAIVPFVL